MKHPRQTTAVRLSRRTLRRVEALRAPVSTIWRDATVSDVLRMLVLDSLDRIEREGMEAVNGAALLREDEGEDDAAASNPRQLAPHEAGEHE